MDDIAGQLSLFNEAKTCYDEQKPEPSVDEVIDDTLKKPHKPKKKGQREEDLKDFPQVEVPRDVPEEKLIATLARVIIKISDTETCRAFTEDE